MYSATVGREWRNKTVTDQQGTGGWAVTRQPTPGGFSIETSLWRVWTCLQLLAACWFWKDCLRSWHQTSSYLISWSKSLTYLHVPCFLHGCITPLSFRSMQVHTVTSIPEPRKISFCQIRAAPPSRIRLRVGENLKSQPISLIYGRHLQSEWKSSKTARPDKCCGSTPPRLHLSTARTIKNELPRRHWTPLSAYGETLLHSSTAIAEW